MSENGTMGNGAGANGARGNGAGGRGSQTSISRYHQEKVLWQEDVAAEAHLSRLADRILDWLDDFPSDHGVLVLGVFGGRGTGKSSLLQILGQKALQKGNGGREGDCASKYVLPTMKADEANDNTKPRLFGPERLQGQDSLLFQLVKHLEGIESSAQQITLGITIESCPSSNMVVANLDTPPALGLMEAEGLQVAVATDDAGILDAWPQRELGLLEGNGDPSVDRNRVTRALAAAERASFIRLRP